MYSMFYLILISHKKTLVNRQNTRIVIEDHPDEVNDHTPLFTLEAPLSSEEEEADSGNESGTISRRTRK